LAGAGVVVLVPVCHDLFGGFYALRLLMTESIGLSQRWKTHSADKYNSKLSKIKT
jgi:hypothetical protein